MGVQNDIKRFIVLVIIVVAGNLASTITQIADGTLIVDGKLTSACINPVCGLLFMVVLIALLIRNNQIKAEEGSGNEES